MNETETTCPNCRNVMSLQLTECPHCGFEFQPFDAPEGYFGDMADSDQNERQADLAHQRKISKQFQDLLNRTLGL